MTRQPGLPQYDDPSKVPERVWRAVEQTRAAGFELACIPEVGRLLQLLAGLHGVLHACELGTAYGVGAAWIESGLRPEARLTTIELDAGRAAAAGALFKDSARVEVLRGDWTDVTELGPFDLLFSDGGPKRRPGDPERLAPLVRAGGIVVLDDYTPGWSGPDISRDIWLDSELFRTAELTLTPAAAVLLAVRR